VTRRWLYPWATGASGSPTSTRSPAPRAVPEPGTAGVSPAPPCRQETPTGRRGGRRTASDSRAGGRRRTRGPGHVVMGHLAAARSARKSSGLPSALARHGSLIDTRRRWANGACRRGHRAPSSPGCGVPPRQGAAAGRPAAPGIAGGGTSASESKAVTRESTRMTLPSTAAKSRSKAMLSTAAAV